MPSAAVRPLARSRRLLGLGLLALTLATSGFSSCAGAVGPLFAPLTITPSLVILRASQTTRQDAVGLARIDGGTGRNRYRTSVDYGKDSGTGWLTITVEGAELTLKASPGGLEPGIKTAKVTVDDTQSGNSGTLDVEFTVLP